jgi:hypothetical protein
MLKYRLESSTIVNMFESHVTTWEISKMVERKNSSDLRDGTSSCK